MPWFNLATSLSKFSEELEGKWYGQRQALGSTYQIAMAKVLEQERSQLPKNEQVNLIFRGDRLMMEPRDRENTIVDSAKYRVSADSILTAGHYKTKIMNITKASLILYSKDELILKSLRIFTRQK
ncbi:hypothetical protein [Pedobacter sp. R-06]|uniref:hypothetical protein n=1 Tax=Pedobacter sp. R-06 TaxID=3404051 RepID=UPI003CEC7E36